MNIGAQQLVLQAEGPISKISWVQKVTGTKMYSWTTQRTGDQAMGWVAHSFRVTPECPYTLLRQDILSKMRAHKHFLPKGPQLTDPKRDLYY